MSGLASAFAPGSQFAAMGDTSLHEHGEPKAEGPKLAKCQRDPWLKEITTRVVSGDMPWPEGLGESRLKTKSKGKKKKETAYAVQLEDTVMFPEGGGQPTDSGMVGGQRCGLVIRQEDGTIIHKVSKPIEAGTEVKVTVDWERRLDHMQQHSGQHLISAVARIIYGGETLSWTLRPYPEFNECELSCELTAEQAADVEKRCNVLIRETRPMPIHIFHDDESIEKFAENEPEFHAKKLAEGKGPLRSIEIPEVEFNTCCGTHTTNTGQLQGVYIELGSVANGKTTMSFIAGDRVPVQMSRLRTNEAAITRLLNNDPAKHAAIVEKLQEQVKSVSSELKRTTNLLMESDIAELRNCGKRVVHKHLEVQGLPYANTVAKQVLEEVAGGNKPPEILVFTVGDPTANKGSFLLAGPPDVVKATGNKFKEAIKGRGGGKPGRLQGNAENLKNLPEALELLSAALK